MAGPSESVLIHILQKQHLLPFQRKNPRSNEWLQESMCARTNGRLSGGTIPEHEIMLSWMLETESTTNIRKLAIGWRRAAI
jgi:hypothetical protein